ncbi:MAG: hypothetical protein QGG42_10700 [Phycisphaerae bacterium]|jgi:hypothetical protein|nr:hypothetical protein [Phycisphaerae bacterium]
MRKTVMMQILTAAILAISLVGAGGCDNGGGESAAETSSLTPSSAVGVVHINVAKARDAITAAAEKDKEMFGPFLAYIELLKKIDSVDMFLVPSGREPMPMFAIRGGIGVDDVEGIIAQTPLKGAKLVKGENGRYTIEGAPLMMIIGDEADDVPAGVVLAGLAPMLTPEFIASLGKEKNSVIEAMLSKVDTSAQIWGGVMMPKEEQKHGAPEQMFGSANITGPEPLNISLLFTDKTHAADTMKEFNEEAPPFIKEVIALKQDGATVNVSMIGEGNLIDNATKMVKGMLGAMMGPMGQPAPPTPIDPS